MPEPAGYLVNRKDGLAGSPGVAYDYVLAGNGLFMQASNHLIQARFPLAKTTVKGLPHLNSELTLKRGPIPAAVLAQALDHMHQDTSHELYCAVVHDGEQYKTAIPQQSATRASVNYEPVSGAVMDLHSHPASSASFSITDDEDETGFRLYAVIGPLHTHAEPAISVRIGIYGVHQRVHWSRIFSRPEITGLKQYTGS